MKTDYLDKLWVRGKKFLGVRYPIMCGAMSWISEHRLVSAIAESGGFGVLAAGNQPAGELEKEIEATAERTAQPFGVNLIAMSPNFSAHLEAALSLKVPIVIIAGGLPSAKTLGEISAAGVKSMAFAPTLAVARRLVKSGVGGLIIEGNEAGGHIGPVSASVLAQEILPFVKEVPVFVAGGIGSGFMIAHYLLMGAAGCQLGTRFVVAQECVAHARAKREFMNSSARDAMPTSHFGAVLPTIPVRALENKGTVEFYRLQVKLISELEQGLIDKQSAELKLEEFWSGALRRALLEGDAESGSMMAGQSVGMARREQPVKEIVEELVSEAERTIERVARRLRGAEPEA